MIRALVILMCLSVPALADPTVDAEAVRLQATEAAVRAGQTSPRAVIRNVRPVERTAAAPEGTAPQGVGRGADGFFPLRRATARDFPLPPRSESQPSGSGLQALVTAGQATAAGQAKAATPEEADKAAHEARDTAAGLQAIKDFRHNHGLQ
jgi:hypothetical protein